MIPKLYNALIDYKDTRKIKFKFIIDIVIFAIFTFAFLYKFNILQLFVEIKKSIFLCPFNTHIFTL